MLKLSGTGCGMDKSWFVCEPEDEARMTHISNRYTPCELLRQAYKKVDDPEVRMLLRIATSMTKSMAARLTKYEGKGWGQKIYPRNPLCK